MDYTFSSLRYTRPDFDELGRKAEEIREQIRGAGTYEEVKECLCRFDDLQDEAGTMIQIAYIRHTLDTGDAFYEEENQWIDHVLPVLEPKILAVNEALMESPFRKELEKEYGNQLFAAMELKKRAFCEENIPLMQREAELVNEYQRLMAAARIEFDQKILNLYGIQKYFEDEDREVRRAAYKAYSDFYHGNEERMEEIWGELISLRNQMGRNLGFENFIPLGYLQQGRMDYGPEDVRRFRMQVERDLVPLCEKLYASQKERIGVETLMAYDEKRVFADGNAVPAGDDDFMIGQARKMYHEISPETAEFIDFMIEHELMDLKNLPGKASTGYMTSLPTLKAPFVFSCFNSTIGDMQVLSHELGHAFAGYMAMKTQPTSRYYDESTDIAEIHSMTMEQFAYPYAELFFGDQADKYRFQHLQEAITFVPFGVAVDEFQHICYENPQLSPRERTLEWKKLEKRYMPWRKYDADDFFDRGGFWYHKLHIFHYPMYYINYTLTTIGAMEYAGRNLKEHEQVWQDYLRLCSCGGSMGYKETLRYANLSDPFEEGSVKKAAAYAAEVLKIQM